MPILPARPSREHLRKTAKRIAREHSQKLGEAQRFVAREYDFPSWAALMRHIADLESPLFAAVRSRDVAGVRRALASGVNPRHFDRGETALHLAARTGPLEIVEALLAGGALEWQPDQRGRTPLEAARRGRARERGAIMRLLDRTTIDDLSFRTAVNAIHAGDARELARLIDAQPRLLHERIRGPEIYRTVDRFQYFLDPKLVWFVANNPTLVARMPNTITDVAQVMIDRGAEPRDLDYALELTMTSRSAREHGLQRPLMRLLLDAGATVSPHTIAITAAHRELDALRALVEAGESPSVPLAAALGDLRALQMRLPHAGAGEIQTAFGLAVINGHIDAVRMTLDAGADVNAYLPIHSHSTALHDTTSGTNTALIALLLERGARRDARDTLWDGTPLDWARYGDNDVAAAALAE